MPRTFTSQGWIAMADVRNASDRTVGHAAQTPDAGTGWQFNRWPARKEEFGFVWVRFRVMFRISKLVALFLNKVLSGVSG
jgi:hypothetical protein